MDELVVVDSPDNQPLLVSWDLGRRCNYDCTYCPSHRHDNFSPLASLEDLKKSAAFVFEYLSLMMPHRSSKFVSISFTGGEPTVNPAFIEFGKWLRQEHEAQYKDMYYLNLALTSNGATSRAMCDNLIENYNFATISYHTEAHDRLKKMSIDNMFYLHEKGFGIKVNVMFHARADYFAECQALCEKLAAGGIDYVPRLIGEYEDNNRYHHKYTDEQMAWMRAFWDKSKSKLNAKKKDIGDEEELQTEHDDAPKKADAPKSEPKIASQPMKTACDSPSKEPRAGLPKIETPKIDNATKAAGDRITGVAGNVAAMMAAPAASADKPKAEHSARSLGRPCCGKREMSVCNSAGNWEKTSFLSYAKFKDWYCSVNWFFLHIEQQSGHIYHHQTCQANFGGKREAIGHFDDAAAILGNLRAQMNAGTMPVIVCPNKICGCGLCTPKSAGLEAFKKILPRHVDQKIFANNPLFASATEEAVL